jgi:uncharacterized protein YheU (UPF0270 family)
MAIPANSAIATASIVFQFIVVSSFVLRAGEDRPPMETTLGFRAAAFAVARHSRFVPHAHSGP